MTFAIIVIVILVLAQIITLYKVYQVSQVSTARDDRNKELVEQGNQKDAQIARQKARLNELEI